MQNNLSTFLWFDSNADQAVRHYCEIFPEAKVTSRNGQSTSFELSGQRYIAFNGGKHYELTPAVSLFVSCENQAEVDALWEKFISAGGTESRCGWLTDKFGLSWQIIPKTLLGFLSDPNPAKAKRALDSMLTMKKIDIAAIERAHAG